MAGWQRFMIRIFLVLVIVSCGGCLEAFTRATNQPPTAHYEAGGDLSRDDLPTPQLLDFRLKFTDD